MIYDCVWSLAYELPIRNPPEKSRLLVHFKNIVLINVQNMV